MKQFASACERNKDHILSVLKDALPAHGLVLEIGSGTGQHAAYFAAHLPQLEWQPSDLPDSHASIAAWCEEAALPNLRPPVAIDLLSDLWPALIPNAILCINTIHIVAWRGVENLFAGAGVRLARGGILYVYGPYRYATRTLEPSNEDFDRWLKARDANSGVRDFGAVDALATQHGFALVEDRAMPANNRSIWWRKR